MTDLDFCRESLRAVSRTFSRPIELLPPDLEVAVTCGYLLCRVVDTIEDQPAAVLATDAREDLYVAFLRALEAPADAARAAGLAAGLARLPGDGADLALGRAVERVLRVFASLPDATRARCTPWIAEMARGMALYGRRPAGPSGLVALESAADLDRYCYFVAGTVGRMLTGLFVDALAPLDAERRRTLEREAEEFGIALQLVNVLKDVAEDHARGWSFVPRDACEAAGILVSELCDPARRRAAHAALAPTFDRAERALDAALRYCLALPEDAREVRLFCLVPLWLAVRTIVLARGNDLLFDRAQAVKITRAEVETLIADCLARAGDDAALLSGYSALWTTSPARATRAGAQPATA